MKRTIFLFLLGTLHMFAYLVGHRGLRGIAAATAASPAPKVFCSEKGLETFSSTFTLTWKDHLGETHQLLLDRQTGARLPGPYNRRNVYGAALAYGPILPNNLRDPILSFAFTGEAPMLTALGIDPATIAGPIRVMVTPKNGDAPFVMEVTP